METPKLFRVAEVQLDILKVLWKSGEGTVAQVRSSLKPTRPLAYSTILTLLRKMENRGIVAHRTEGRTFVYRPLVNRQNVRTSAVSNLLQKVFGGSAEALVASLLESNEIAPDEMERIQKLIHEKEKGDATRRKS